MKHEHFLGSACRFMLRKKEKKFLCILDSGLRGFINEILHAATSPCKCSDYHRDGLSVNLSLPMLSNYLSPLNWQPSPVWYPSPFTCSTPALVVGDDFLVQVCARVTVRGGSEVIQSTAAWRKVSGVSWELRRQRAVSYWTWSPYTGEQIENLFLSLQALTRVAQLKETIAVWH